MANTLRISHILPVTLHEPLAKSDKSKIRKTSKIFANTARGERAITSLS